MFDGNAPAFYRHAINALSSYRRVVIKYRTEKLRRLDRKQIRPESLFVCHRKFHQISLDKVVYLTIHYAIDIARLVISTVIFYPSVVKNIASDLASHSIFFFPASILACASKRFFIALS